MDKKTVVARLLQGYSKVPHYESGTFFAPANIALCKYWGKRNTELNLPTTSSLSISLDYFGARTTISFQDGDSDLIILNEQAVDSNSTFAKNFSDFLNLFRFTPATVFRVETEVNIPIGAGLASSACGFAAAVGAIDAFFGWALPPGALSILARLGSGSASRSFWHGFVEWRAGEDPEGMDSQGVFLKDEWPDLRIGLLILNTAQKILSSRLAMQQTVCTSPLYSVWPEIHHAHLLQLKEAIQNKDFTALGQVSEANALAMHAVMLTAAPSILYSEPKTVEAIQKIWQSRKKGLPLFFTQDAGPNLKLLFLKTDAEAVMNLFPELTVVAPFSQSRGD